MVIAAVMVVVIVVAVMVAVVVKEVVVMVVSQQSAVVSLTGLLPLTGPKHVLAQIQPTKLSGAATFLAVSP